MFCVMCDALIPDDSIFCNKCGSPVNTEPIDQTESSPQPFAQRFQPFEDMPRGSQIYQTAREPVLRSAYTQAWAEGISILESDTESRNKLGGWFKNLKNSLFSKNAAAPIAFELNQCAPSQADFQQQPFTKEARRSKPNYYTAGKRTYERKKYNA